MGKIILIFCSDSQKCKDIARQMRGAIERAGFSTIGNNKRPALDGFSNAQGFDGGVTVTGTGQAGAAVIVTIAGIAQETVVDVDGNWSAT